MLDAELAILSIVAEAPSTGRAGRDVNEIITERNLRLWTMIGVESIYYVLEKLETQGLILNVDRIPPEDKQWRVYRITTAGRGVLQTSVNDLLASVRQHPTRFELGLANIAVLKTSQAKNALLSHQSDLQARYQMVQKQYTYLQEQAAPFHILSMFEHQLTVLEAEIAWLAAWFAEWEAQAAPDPEEAPLAPSIELPHLQEMVLPRHGEPDHQKATRRSEKAISESDDLPPPPQKRERTYRPPSDPNPTRLNKSTPPKPIKRSEE
jgi:DNA-binding PadR family transcriptional regulator